jgi:hypothetical protein
VPAGPGDAVVVAVGSVLRERLVEAGWNVRSVPIAARDLASFDVRPPPRGLDLVAIDVALSGLTHADKRAALAMMARWLRPDGQLLLREPIVDEGAASIAGSVWRGIRRLSRLEASANDGAATVEFYVTALEHVGWRSIDVLNLQEGVVVITSHSPNSMSPPRSISNRDEL